MSPKARTTSVVSIRARKTKGADLSILSNIWPPISVKRRVPSWPNTAKTPVMVPLIALGIPRMNSTSMLTASTTVKIIKRQQRVLAVKVSGSLIHRKEYPQMPLSAKAVGISTLDGILSPRIPKMGRRQIVAIVAAKITF